MRLFEIVSVFELRKGMLAAPWGRVEGEEVGHGGRVLEVG